MIHDFFFSKFFELFEIYDGFNGILTLVTFGPQYDSKIMRYPVAEELENFIKRLKNICSFR